MLEILFLFLIFFDVRFVLLLLSVRFFVKVFFSVKNRKWTKTTRKKLWRRHLLCVSFLFFLFTWALRLILVCFTWAFWCVVCAFSHISAKGPRNVNALGCVLFFLLFYFVFAWILTESTLGAQMQAIFGLCICNVRVYFVCFIFIIFC